MSLAEKITANGPKKIFTLDGGGIRGILTVEILAKIEALLRDQTGAGKDFVLADYFDFFAGTSTGAIVAACLSWGMTVERIRNFYLQNGRRCSTAHRCSSATIGTNFTAKSSRRACKTSLAPTPLWAAIS